VSLGSKRFRRLGARLRPAVGLGLAVCMELPARADPPPAALVPGPGVCEQKLPRGALSLPDAERAMWGYYWSGPGGATPRPAALEAFPIACRVQASYLEGKTAVAAGVLLNAVADCRASRPVLVSTGGIGRIVARCARWELRGQPSAAALASFVASVEIMGLTAPAFASACVDQSADLVRARLAAGPDVALLGRLDQAVADYHDAARCQGVAIGPRPAAGGVGPGLVGSMQDDSTRPQFAEQEAYRNVLRDRDTSHRLAGDQQVRETSDRTGNGTSDAPDDASTLRRQAKDFLASNHPGRAVEALERAVQILTLAFGDADPEVKSATAELQAARAVPGPSGFPVACAARLPGVAATPQEIMSPLRANDTAAKAGMPIPPAVYGPACRALSGEEAFAGEHWSDPLVTQPLMNAARASLPLIPAAAAPAQASALVDQASRLGLGPGPEFSTACPDALLGFAQDLLERYRLPVDPRIAAVRARLLDARACARSAAATTGP
jgi:hypothetical protein